MEQQPEMLFVLLHKMTRNITQECIVVVIVDVMCLLGDVQVVLFELVAFPTKLFMDRKIPQRPGMKPEKRWIRLIEFRFSYLL